MVQCSAHRAAAQGKVAILDHSVFSNYLNENVNINHILKG